MQTDLFETKQAQLISYLKTIKVFASSDVIAWGVANFYNRADRTKRELLNKGLIVKLREGRLNTKLYEKKEAIYAWRGER